MTEDVIQSKNTLTFILAEGDIKSSEKQLLIQMRKNIECNLISAFKALNVLKLKKILECNRKSFKCIIIFFFFLKDLNFCCIFSKWGSGVQDIMLIDKSSMYCNHKQMTPESVCSFL